VFPEGEEQKNMVCEGYLPEWLPTAVLGTSSLMLIIHQRSVLFRTCMCRKRKKIFQKKKKK